MSGDNAHDKKLTLEPGDITDVAPVHRRSALASIGLAVGAAVGVVMAIPSDGEACRRRTGVTDSDAGNGADGVNRGRTNITDSDSGDQVNCGRGGRRAGNRVRARTNCTDSDGGPGADGVNYGRHCGVSGCTDSDTGSMGDQPNNGRHCR